MVLVAAAAVVAVAILIATTLAAAVAAGVSARRESLPRLEVVVVRCWLRRLPLDLAPAKREDIAGFAGGEWGRVVETSDICRQQVTNKYFVDRVPSACDLLVP